MPELLPISVFVKLRYWDVYLLNVVLTARLFRKLLYIWGFVALLWLGLSVLLLFRPAPEQEWAAMLQNGSALTWVLALPVIFLFGLPLLSSRRVLGDDRIKQGVSYQFSASGVHIKTSVSATNLSWAAIPQVSEIRSAFLLFTSPNIAISLPKRCFENHETVAALRELLRTHVPKSKLRTH